MNSLAVKRSDDELVINNLTIERPNSIPFYLDSAQSYIKMRITNSNILFTTSFLTGYTYYHELVIKDSVISSFENQSANINLVNYNLVDFSNIVFQ
jgi:hypothetical protein